MILAGRLPGERRSLFSDARAWIDARPWAIVSVVLTMWALFPMIRRLIDWKLGAAPVSIISVIPLISLLLAVIPFVYGGRLRLLDRDLRLAAWLWFGGFTFSFVVALTSGSGGAAAALYAYLGFALPAVFGLWFATVRGSMTELYDKVAITALWLCTALSLYAIVQFVRPPEWDVQWMLNAKIVAFGVPLPYQLRAFSTLNGPGTYADFVLFSVMLNLPRLRKPTPLAIGQLGVALAGLLLTLVRGDWGALIVGVIVYIALTPDRARNFNIMIGVVFVLGLFVANVSSLLGNSAAGSDLQNRLDTFGNLGNDVSYNERSRYFDGPLQEALRTPLGLGLGVLGTAAKIGSGGQTLDFDNGYIARFTEMGYFGTLCYLSTIGFTAVVAFRRWRAYKRLGREDLAGRAASVLAILVMLMALDMSSDHHNAIEGLFFWIALALVGGRDASAIARRVEAAG